MHRRASQLTIAGVAFVLGLLVVLQLRAQASDSALAQLSAQDLTVLVANLNARNGCGQTPRKNVPARLIKMTAFNGPGTRIGEGSRGSLMYIFFTTMM